MAKLPSLTARKVIRALKRAGFVEDRQKEEATSFSFSLKRALEP